MSGSVIPVGIFNVEDSYGNDKFSFQGQTKWLVS